MKRIVFLMLSFVSVLLPVQAPIVRAEGPSESLQLELKLSRTRPLVHPLPDPKIVEKDAKEAVAAIEERERSEKVIRETLRAPSRRPDLNYDIWSGIQSRNINGALRRR